MLAAILERRGHQNSVNDSLSWEDESKEGLAGRLSDINLYLCGSEWQIENSSNKSDSSKPNSRGKPFPPTGSDTGILATSQSKPPSDYKSAFLKAYFQLEDDQYSMQEPSVESSRDLEGQKIELQVTPYEQNQPSSNDQTQQALTTTSRDGHQTITCLQVESAKSKHLTEQIGPNYPWRQHSNTLMQLQSNSYNVGVENNSATGGLEKSNLGEETREYDQLDVKIENATTPGSLKECDNRLEEETQHRNMRMKQGWRDTTGMKRKYTTRTLRRSIPQFPAVINNSTTQGRRLELELSKNLKKESQCFTSDKQPFQNSAHSQKGFELRDDSDSFIQIDTRTTSETRDAWRKESNTSKDGSLPDYLHIVHTNGSVEKGASALDYVQLDDSKAIFAANEIHNGNEMFAFPMLSETGKARSLLLGAAALYGTNFSLVKLLGIVMPVPVNLTLRFGIASFVTLPLLFITHMPPKPSATANLTACFEGENYASGELSVATGQHSTPLAKEDRSLWNLAALILCHTRPEQLERTASTVAGLEVGMWNSVGFIVQAIGLETTAASKSAFLCSLVVVTVPVLDFLSGKPMLPKQLIGVFLAVVGVAFLELGTGHVDEDLVGASMSYGDLASAIQPLAFGLGFWRLETAMALYPQHAARMTAAQIIAAFLICFGYWSLSCGLTQNVCVELSQLQQWLTTPSILLALVWTGVVTIALTSYMEALAMETLSAAESALICSTEPLWGAAFATCIMGEHIGWDDAVGAAFILAGCVFSSFGIDGLDVVPQDKREAETDQSPPLDTAPSPISLQLV